MSNIASQTLLAMFILTHRHTKYYTRYCPGWCVKVYVHHNLGHVTYCINIVLHPHPWHANSHKNKMSIYLFYFVQRPVDVYDRKVSAPAKLPHYHLPVTEDGKRIPSRSRSNYMQQLYGRRSRSLSRLIQILKKIYLLFPKQFEIRSFSLTTKTSCKTLFSEK